MIDSAALCIHDDEYIEYTGPFEELEDEDIEDAPTVRVHIVVTVGAVEPPEDDADAPTECGFAWLPAVRQHARGQNPFERALCA